MRMTITRLKKRPTLVATALVFFIAQMLSGCDKPQTSPTTTENNSSPLVVKIGSAAPLTGPEAHIGKDIENGIRLAITELNAEHITIGNQVAEFKLLSMDDMGDPRTATLVAQKLVDSGVSAVIGHFNSGASIPASKVYNDGGIVQITPASTAVAYTQQGFPGAMRIITNGNQLGTQMAQYTVQKMGDKQIAIIDDRTAYGQGVADIFEKAARQLGASIVKHEFTTDKSSDFNAILTNIKSSDAQVLFFAGLDIQAAPMIKQMHELGMTIPMIGTEGICTAELLKLAGAEANGIICAQPGVPLVQTQNGLAFQMKFNAQYGPIEMYAPYAYDAMHMLAIAMQKAGSTDPAKYRPILATLNYSGVTGDIRFDNKGDLANGATSLYRAENGKWQFIATMKTEKSADGISAPTNAAPTK